MTAPSPPPIPPATAAIFVGFVEVGIVGAREVEVVDDVVGDEELEEADGPESRIGVGTAVAVAPTPLRTGPEGP